MNCIVCGNELKGNQRKYCSKHCQKLGEHRRNRGHAEGIRPIRSHLEMKDSDIQDRINTKSDKIIYLGGYVNDKSKIYVQCKDCGNIYAKTTKCLRPSGHKNIQCSYCLNILSNIREKERREQLLLNKEQKHLETLQRRESEKAERQTKECAYCGKTFLATYRNSCCSEDCRRKLLNSKHSDLKRIRNLRKKYNGNYDNNISLKVLYKRDNGKCWICGKPCEWQDKYTTEQGHRVTGANYPSKDHVIPLAKGGTHTWDNVRLAHFKCNTDKGAKLIVKGENNQLVLIL